MQGFLVGHRSNERSHESHSFVHSISYNLFHVCFSQVSFTLISSLRPILQLIAREYQYFRLWVVEPAVQSTEIRPPHLIIGSVISDFVDNHWPPTLCQATKKHNRVLRLEHQLSYSSCRRRAPFQDLYWGRTVGIRQR
jgi:hypothetical protein